MESNSQHCDIKREIKSRTQEYADKWNQNMFLNDFDKRDENAGVNVKLSDVYIEKHLPHYIWGNNNNESDDLKDLLSEYINEKSKNKMLFVLGQPGMGKSTLITWITANFTNSIDDILVFDFASDLKNIDWINKYFEFSVVDQILTQLHLSYENLEGKTLIIDGFDEINVGDDRTKVLNRIYRQLTKLELEGLSVIITCRENYIEKLDKLKCNHIILQPWDEAQIKSFCNVFQEKTGDNISENTLDKIIESFLYNLKCKGS